MKIPKSVFRAAYELDLRFDLALRAAARRLGIERPLRVVPYRGYGTPHRVRVRARVLGDRGQLTPSLERGWVRGVGASVQRFRTLEIPGCRVEVVLGGSRDIGRSDDEGFVDIELGFAEPLDAGWHDARLALVDDWGLDAVAPVQIIDRAPLAIVTDVDDTIIDSGIANRARRTQAMFLGEVRRRRPFSGTGELFQALAAGRGGEPNPVFYVSSSPWNLYDHLEHFFEVYGLPAGPILLRDWGLRRDGFAPDGRHSHKREKIQRIMADLPDHRFLLIGDSGQRDAENYLDLVQAARERIAGVMIRRVPIRKGREGTYAGWIEALEKSGVPVVEFSESDEALREAQRLGFI